MLSTKNVYANQMFYCYTREYPIQGRSINTSTFDENGELISTVEGLYQFSAQSVYGYYNVTCEVRGHYEMASFYFKATYRVHYTGELGVIAFDVG